MANGVASQEAKLPHEIWDIVGGGEGLAQQKAAFEVIQAHWIKKCCVGEREMLLRSLLRTRVLEHYQGVLCVRHGAFSYKFQNSIRMVALWWINRSSQPYLFQLRVRFAQAMSRIHEAQRQV